MEAVLSGVTAGVVGVDSDGVVTLVNRSAETLLQMKAADLVGQPLAKSVPEFAPVLKRAQKQGKRLVTDQVTLRRQGSERNFAVRVTSEGQDHDAQGFVVTFDDMTELVTAQRSTAWADVARRIAHEIKNPLTPIQLSAERIRRKYGNSITKDREVFDQCTNTIIRQVSDIGRMVDEFSAFRPHAETGDGASRRARRRARGRVPVPGVDDPTSPSSSIFPRRRSWRCPTGACSRKPSPISSRTQAKRSTRPSRRTPRARAQDASWPRSAPGDDQVQITVIDNGCGLP